MELELNVAYRIENRIENRIGNTIENRMRIENRMGTRIENRIGNRLKIGLKIGLGIGLRIGLKVGFKIGLRIGGDKWNPGDIWISSERQFPTKTDLPSVRSMNVYLLEKYRKAINHSESTQSNFILRW